MEIYNLIPGKGFSAIPGREGFYPFTQTYSSYLAVGDACKNGVIYSKRIYDHRCWWKIDRIGTEKRKSSDPAN